MTTNISPGAEGASLDFFFTTEIVSIVDPASGETLDVVGEPARQDRRARDTVYLTNSGGL